MPKPKLHKCWSCKGKFERTYFAELIRHCGQLDCMTAVSMEILAKRKKAEAKRRAKEAKEYRKETKIRKEAIKKKGDWMKEAQAVINKYVRVRDQGKPCVSCNATYDEVNRNGGSVIDCGHYRSRGAASHLRFNLYNMAGQCVKCNRYNSGNAVDYRLGLIDRIGVERVERLEADNEPRTFDIDYLKRVKKIFTKRARHLQKLRGTA